jgi:hypothetical protein
VPLSPQGLPDVTTHTEHAAPNGNDRASTWHADRHVGGREYLMGVWPDGQSQTSLDASRRLFLKQYGNASYRMVADPWSQDSHQIDTGWSAPAPPHAGTTM